MPQSTYLSNFTSAAQDSEDAYDFECEMKRDFEEDYEGEVDQELDQELDQTDFEHDLEDAEDGLGYEGDN